MRVVIDTSVVISSLLQPEGNSRRAFVIALWDCLPIMSLQTFGELLAVVQRPKFIHKIDESDLMEILDLIATRSENIVVTSTLAVCRDSKDDIFINLAIDGKADVILTRDPDLLVLHPFRNISILSPSDFLKSSI